MHINFVRIEVNVLQSNSTKRLIRALDLTISLTTLAISSPVIALSVLGTFGTNVTLRRNGRKERVPYIYKSARLGQNGQRFEMFKLGSMHNGTNKNGALLGDPQRLTKFGAFIRKWRIDELLNFLNVLSGQMSVVGPRPLPDKIAKELQDKEQNGGTLTSLFKERSSVKPGITGPSQTCLTQNYRNDELNKGRLESDLRWIRTKTPLKDYFWYVAQTFSAVYQSKGNGLRAAPVATTTITPRLPERSL